MDLVSLFTFSLWPFHHLRIVLVLQFNFISKKEKKEKENYLPASY